MSDYDPEQLSRHLERMKGKCWYCSAAERLPDNWICAECAEFWQSREEVSVESLAAVAMWDKDWRNRYSAVMQRSAITILQVEQMLLQQRMQALSQAPVLIERIAKQGTKTARQYNTDESRKIIPFPTREE